MAKISFIWDGKTKTPAETTFNYNLGSNSGYANYPSSVEKWTGINLKYDISISSLPVSGVLSSFSQVRNNGVFSLSITDLNLVIPQNITYESLVVKMLEGQDQWYGDDNNNYFYLSVGGDTYNGGGGVDTVDAFFTKADWITSATTINNVSSGVIRFDNFGSTKYTSLTLNSVERLKFSDVSIAFDLDANAGKVVKILGAIFGKSAVSNKEYVGIGLNLLDSGMSYDGLMNLALNAKLGAKYTTDSAINLIYSNVFGLIPSVQTVTLFRGLIDGGYASAAELAIVAAETSNNKINVNLVGLSQSGVEYIPA